MHIKDQKNPYGDILTYDPETGEVWYTETGERLPVRVSNRNPYTMVNKVRENLRPLVISLHTGEWPTPGDYKFISEDKTDLRWVNFRSTKPGEGKYCPCCDTVKSLPEFTKSSASTSGYGAYCKACNAAKAAGYVRKPNACSVCGPAETGVCPSCLRGARAFDNNPRFLIKMAKLLLAQAEG